MRERKGFWMSLFYPDAKYMMDDQAIQEPEEREGQQEQGLWLKLFGPGDSWRITSFTDLP